MRKQSGTTLVEFTVIASLFFMVLFGVIEMGRLLFTWNAIAEITRRGARVAAVCPMNDANINIVAVMAEPGSAGDSPILPNLKAANISVTYLDDSGSVSASYEDTTHVRVGVSNYRHRLLIPFIPDGISVLDVPAFATTTPTESLGWQPENGIRACFS